MLYVTLLESEDFDRYMHDFEIFLDFEFFKTNKPGLFLSIIISLYYKPSFKILLSKGQTLFDQVKKFKKNRK